MTSRVRSKNVVVTGASRGLGLALASSLSANGHRVIGLCRQQPIGIETQEACAEWIHTDLSVMSEVEKAAAQINALLPEGLDCLVNNAGIGFHCRIGSIQADELEKVFAVNSLAPILLMSRLLSSLESRKGLVVNITSCLVDLEMRFTSVYTASKRALYGFGRVLRAERGIRVCSVEPGAMETDFLRNTHDAPVKTALAARKLAKLKPPEVAARIVEVIEGPTNMLVERLHMIPDGQRD